MWQYVQKSSIATSESKFEKLTQTQIELSMDRKNENTIVTSNML